MKYRFFANISSLFVCLLLLLVVNFSAYAQQSEPKKRSRVNIIRADVLESITLDNGVDINICRGDVVFEHDSAFMYCDSALLYQKQNYMHAYGNVHLTSTDTLNLWGDSLKYYGDTKVAYVFQNVKLTDENTTLYTDFLVYNRIKEQAYYPKKGRIVDSTNQLTSNVGYYFTKQNRFFFKDSVVVKNDDFIAYSDTLLYHTKKKKLTFLGPTHIYGKEKQYMYCEDGWYRTEQRYAKLKKNVFLSQQGSTLKCDSLFYDKANEKSNVFSNIVVTDSVKGVVVTGNYAKYDKRQRYLYMVDSAQLIAVDQPDSLFLHADTLYTRFDSIGEVSSVEAYYDVCFFKEQLQGRCDSLSYTTADSSIRLFENPILWAKDTQMTSDTIVLHTVNQEPTLLHLSQNAFIISADTIEGYNQVKGREIDVYFKDSELNKMLTYGNAESLYYMRDENGDLVGIDKATSSWLYIIFEESTMKEIVYRDNVISDTYPEGELPENARLLRDFNWREAERPKDKTDIFRGREE